MIEALPIKCILPRPGRPLRKLDPEHVKSLAASIRDIGLQCPISVHAIPCKTDPPAAWSHNGNNYLLVTGQHRFDACCSLGWTEIPAIVLDLDDMERELWEIDENLAYRQFGGWFAFPEPQRTRR